jgi:hypothetical protein
MTMTTRQKQRTALHGPRSMPYSLGKQPNAAIIAGKRYELVNPRQG